ncbi:hypothetical protein QTH34_12685 [Clostridium perfringens]|nr:hypothetical protein [Clostridium perfringens]
MFKKIFLYLKRYFSSSSAENDYIINTCLKYVSKEDYLYIIEKSKY